MEVEDLGEVAAPEKVWGAALEMLAHLGGKTLGFSMVSIRCEVSIYHVELNNLVSVGLTLR